MSMKKQKIIDDLKNKIEEHPKVYEAMAVSNVVD